VLRATRRPTSRGDRHVWPIGRWSVAGSNEGGLVVVEVGEPVEEGASA
jgi:hypothetical protein